MADFTAAGQPAAQSDLHAFIALAKDPEGFASKLSQLKAAQEAADEARANARAAQQELGEEKNALNARAAAVEKQAAKLAKDAEYLEKERAAHEADKRIHAAHASDRNRELNARENDLAAKAATVEEAQRAAIKLNRLAQQDRDAAKAYLAKVQAVVASLDTLKAQIADLG
jgi:chromosome segregation ATPase